MKLQLNKLMAGLVMAGGAVALVGCGDGGSPTLGASSNITKVIKAGDTVAIQGAKTITSAFGEAGANFPLGTKLVFDANVTPGAKPTDIPPIPANSILNLNPTTTAGAIADFKITAPNTNKTVEGIVLPGSCKFRVTGPSDLALLLDGYVIGEDYAFNNCVLGANTNGVSVGVPTEVGSTLTLGSTTIAASRTIKVTVKTDGSVSVVIPVIKQVPVLGPDGKQLLDENKNPVFQDEETTEIVDFGSGTVSLTTGA